MANRIAKWNGSTWTNLGVGMAGSSPVVSALAVDGVANRLYAGGEFTMAGDKVSARAAYYDIVPEPVMLVGATLPLVLMLQRRNY